MTDQSTGPREETIWSGSPSHSIYLGTYVLCALFFWLVIPIFLALWRWLQVKSLHYEITTQRLRFTYGLFSRRSEEIELYRVKDTTLLEPFKLRLCGVGNLVVETHDVSTPELVLQGIPNPRDLRERLRQAIEAVRDRKRVRMVENE